MDTLTAIRILTDNIPSDDECKPALDQIKDRLQYLGEQLTRASQRNEGLTTEMRRYLPVLERTEADPETRVKLTEGLGIATVNGYRNAITK